MPSKMHITELRIKNYRQFRNIHLNFCDPSTGEPLDKVCFIGSNGTGKTTLLRILSWMCEPNFVGGINNWDVSGLLSWQVKIDGESFFILKSYDSSRLPNFHLILPKSIEESHEWHELWEDTKQFNASHPLFNHFKKIGEQYHDMYLKKIMLQSDLNDLAIHSLSDGFQWSGNLPNTNLGDALKLFENPQSVHISNTGDIINFWNSLIYQVAKRIRDYQSFLVEEPDQSITLAEARQKFDQLYPEILEEIARLWNLILEPTGLEFDVANAKRPILPNENLEAYIRVRDSHQVVPYGGLSTGIRNFIFRLGHIYTLYFNRQIERGFLFLDEPGQSLYPDFLYDIIERYLSVIHNTQLFVATHSEIVAAQFKPSERIRLQFESDGSVSWRRGISPEGDDPNDVLLNDFAVRNLYGKEGLRQWQRYLHLRHEIVTTEDMDTKMRLMDEYLKIGDAYNFAPNEIPE